MKNFVVIFFTLFFLGGCSVENGFSYFDFTLHEQNWENNRMSSPIAMKQEQKAIGTVTAVYLNKVYPELYHDGEYFYISIYTKQDMNATQCFLNGELSLLQEELQSGDRFENLGHSTKWDKVYLVGFKELKGQDTLTLVVKNNDFSSTPMTFKKDE